MNKPFRFGLQAYAPNSGKEWRELARKAEASGFSSFHLADHIIGPGPALTATVAKLPASVRTVEYPQGYHMLTRDLQAERVWADVAAFINDPKAPLPSNLGPIGSAAK